MNSNGEMKWNSKTFVTMKKNIFMLVSVAALISSVSCQKENIGAPATGTDGPKRTVTAYAEIAETETKVEFGKNDDKTPDYRHLVWRTSDQFGIYSENDDNVPSSKYKAGEPFQFELNEATTEFTAYLPYKDNGSKDLQLETSQIWYFENFPSFYPLKAEGKIDENDTATLKFKPLFCSLQLRLFGSPYIADEKADTLISVNLKTAVNTISLKQGSSHRKINVSGDRTNAGQVYLTVPKEVIPAGSEFTISTGRGVYTITTSAAIDVTNYDFKTINFDLSNKIPAIDYYEKGISIDGVLYQKGVNDSKLNQGIYNNYNGIYFIDSDRTGISSNGGHNNLVVIGRSSTAKSKLTLNNCLLSDGNEGTIIFKNLILDCSAASGSFIFGKNNTTDSTFEKFIIEDCEIILPAGKAFSWFTSANGKLNIKNFTIRNCTIAGEQGETPANRNIFNLENTYITNLTIDNNLIYERTANPVNNTMLQLNNTDALSLDITNNTFVNVTGLDSYAQWMFKLKPGTGINVDFSNNLIVSENATTTQLRAFQFNGETANFADVTFSGAGNYFYSNSETTCSWAYPVPAGVSGKPEFTKASENPLSICDPLAGNFVLGSAYTGWGSSLVPVE